MRVKMLLLGGALCALPACDSSASAPPYPSLTGEWSFTFRSAGQSPSAEGMVVPRVYLKDANGVVSGHLNGYSVVGQRRGNELDLTLLTQNGTFPSAVSFLQLRALSPDSIEGTAQTPIPADTLGGATTVSTGEVRGTRLVELSEEVIDAKLANPYAPVGLGGGWSKACDLLSGALSFTIGSLTDNAVRPMGTCVLAASGGGYYVFGRTAPGSMAPVWTQNLYVPVELVFPKPWEDPCPERTYKFTFSYKGSALVQDAQTMLEASKYANGSYFDGVSKFLSPGQAVGSLIDQLNAFKSRFGDYAFLLATHPRTKWVGLYVITQRGAKGDVTSSTIVRTVANAFGAEVFTGSEIHDTYGLKRNIVPGACGDFAAFAYLFGTAEVNLN